jgi:GNAT superfamily N-acetyltransferase
MVRGAIGVTGLRPRLEIRPFAPEYADDAARLLADRHRAPRFVEPALDARFEDVAATRTEIEALAGRDGADGAVALRDGLVAGYLIAAPRGGPWGPNMWIEGAGHAVTDPELVRDLYGSLAGGWVEAGAIRHSVVVPASDPALVDAWFRSGFGQQHVHGIREPAAPGDVVQLPAGMTLRRPERGDIPVLGRLSRSLGDHQRASPVFSMVPAWSLDDEMAEWEEGFDDPAFTTFVVAVDDVVVGSAVGCSIDESSEHHGIVRPSNAGFLGFAAVLPEARGLGVGRVLGEAVLAWARDAGHPCVVTDWRETNLLSSRAWPGLGFRPLFRRLHRAIA